MTIVHSKVTAQGQVSVPADVRRKLGVGPGSVLEWSVQDGQVIVRRSGRYSSEEVHQALFSKTEPRHHTLADLKQGIRKSVRKRHARR